MAQTIYGTNAMTRVSNDRSLEQTGKYTVTETWKGPAGAGNAKFDELINAYGVDNVRQTVVAGICTIEVLSATDTVPGGTEDRVIWEVVGGDLVKPLESFPGRPATDDDGGSAAFNTNATSPFIAAALREYQMGNFLYVPVNVAALAFSKIYKLGGTEYLRSTIGVRSVQLLSKRSKDLKSSWKGVDRAWKVSDDNGPKDMDTALLAAMAEIPGWNAAKRQWLKRAPQQRTSDGRVYELAQTWLWAERWGHHVYNGDDEDGNP